MKVKLQEIVNSVGSINNLLAYKFPPKTSYRLMRLAKHIDPIMKTYNEERNRIIEELGEIDEATGNAIVRGKEKMEVFNKRIDEILQVEEYVEFDPISVEDLGGVNVSPNDMPHFVFTD